MLVAQLDVPVGKIDKVPPAFMLRRRKRDMHKRAPLRSLRLANQTHVRLLRKPVAFAGVTLDARANHIFPRRRPASVARHDMIEIQLISLENPAAILARVFVPLENIVTSKLNFLLRETIKKEQHDHTRHPNLPRNRRDDFVIGRGGGEVAPTVEVMGQEIVFVIG